MAVLLFNSLFPSFSLLAGELEQSIVVKPTSQIMLPPTRQNLNPFILLIVLLGLLQLPLIVYAGLPPAEYERLQELNAVEMSKTITDTDRASYLSEDISDLMDNAKKISNVGKLNKDIYTLKGNLVMKVLSSKVSKDEAYGEAKALDMLHELEKSGRIKIRSRIRRTYFPAIIMKRKKGKSLFSSDVYKRANKKERKALKTSVIDKVCEEVAQIAQSSGILHYDNNPDNILLQFTGTSVTSVELIDYGPPYTYLIDKNTDKQKIVDVCAASSVWTLLW
ncbi:hypothetical protein F5879DRAFT_984530 [Lentinula edodes]|nr:hypothetical protein F5879DRAFT_984530 [Lentinula edodes]